MDYIYLIEQVYVFCSRNDMKSWTHERPKLKPMLRPNPAPIFQLDLLPRRHFVYFIETIE